MCCSIEGCDGEVVARGWCNKHYSRWRAHGDPHATVKPHGSLRERFESKVVKTDSCWLWVGGKNKQGYGKLRIGGKGGEHVRAHRVSYELHRGPIPDGFFVMHKCDNPSCVNPEHLDIGTAMDNVADMVSKDRHTYGERTKKSKLTNLAVSVIRESGASVQELMATFNVSKATVYQVKQGRTWKHV